MKFLCLFALAAVCLFGQGAIRVDPLPALTVSSQNSAAKILPVYALPYANVTVCNAPANGTPCTNYAQTYTDSTANTTCPLSTQVVLAGTASCQNQTDGAGSFGFWFAPGQYVYTLIYQGNPYGPYPITVVPNGGPYLAPFSGSAPRTYQSKFSDIISVLDFAGADPTGATDSTAAINNAITAASAQGGGTVYFPRGTYAACNLTLPLGVSFLGSSRGSQLAVTPLPGDVYASEIISNCASTSSPMLNTAEHWSSVVENLTFNANTKSAIILNLINNPRSGSFRNLSLINTAAGSSAIYINYDTSDPDAAPPANNHFDNVSTTNIYSKALVIVGGTFNQFTDCTFESANDDVIVINNGSDDNFFYGGVIFPQTGHVGVVLNYSGDPTNGFQNNFFGTGIQAASGSTAIEANHNDGPSYFFGSYVSCCGTTYVNGGGGQVQFIHSLLPTAATNTITITPTAAPFTYENATACALEVHVAGGTVAGFQLYRNNIGATDLVGPTITATLQPTDLIVVNYSSLTSPNALVMLGIPQCQ